MKKPLTPFDDLAWFLAVANEGSFALAAKTLGADASTVSRRIGRLEEQTGHTLFHRSARGTELSEAGERLARRVQTAMNAITLGLDELSDAKDRLCGAVRVTAPTEVGAAFLIPTLTTFRAAYPDIVVEVELGATLVDLDKREADIALRTVRPTRGDIVTRRLGGLRMAPFHAPTLSSLDASRRWMTWMSTDPYTQRVLAEDPKARVVFRSNDLAGLRAACCAGLGTTLLPLLSGAEHGLTRLAGPVVSGSPLWMAAPRTSLERPRVRALWDFILVRFPALVEEAKALEGVQSEGAV